MNKIYPFVILCLLAALRCSAQYITVWKTDNSGLSNSTSIMIPATGTNYSIAWEEVGNAANSGTKTASGNYTLVFPSAGTYQVSISPGGGTFNRIAFSNGGDRNKLLEIKQWGDIRWASMANAYQGCANLTVTATDAPDLQDVTDMQGMFESCAALTTVPDIDQWDVSRVTNMSRLFYFASVFNAAIGSWDVGNVTNMQTMFHSASAFNQPIGNWNVSNVTSMNSMFYQARAFNQSIANWNVANVTNMGSMFTLATAFNQPVESWNVGNVTDMSYMFYAAGDFNQPIERWNVSKVKNMSNMFVTAGKFDQPLGRWNLNAVTNMTSMLLGSGMQCASMTLTLQGWAGNAATPNNITFGANGRNYGSQAVAALSVLQNDKGWNVTIGVEVTCTLPPRPFVTVWKTDMETESKQIYMPASGTNYSVAWEEVGNPANFGSTTASGALTLTLPSVGTYQLSITRGSGTFNSIVMRSGDSEKLLEVKQWGDVRWTSQDLAFADCVNLKISATDAPDLTNVKSMRGMFSLCTSLASVPGINQWNVSGVTDMSALFSNALTFNEPIGDWNTGNVTNMSSMFDNAIAFNQPIGKWNVSKVTTMSSMFGRARAFDQPIGDWDVSGVRLMRNMFGEAEAFNQPVGGWNVSLVTDMSFMFRLARSFNQPLENWNVAQVRNFSNMFGATYAFNQPLEKWDVSQARIFSAMFSNAFAFNQPLGKWNLSQATDLADMFSSSGMDCENISRTLMAWSDNPLLPNRLSLGASRVQYGSAARAAIDYLINTKGWTITIGTEVPCAALDVSLVSFNVKNEGGMVKLNWVTASETDNDYFEAERSADARNWSAIARIKGAGTTNTTSTYSQIDDAPLAGKAYYRLKIVDFSGKADYSVIRVISPVSSEAGYIFPNPATTAAMLSGRPGSHVKVYNASGRLVMQMEIRSEKTAIPLNALPEGIYVVRSDDGWQTKFVKK